MHPDDTFSHLTHQHIISLLEIQKSKPTIYLEGNEFSGKPHEKNLRELKFIF